MHGRRCFSCRKAGPARRASPSGTPEKAILTCTQELPFGSLYRTLGPVLNETDARAALDAGVTAVLDLTLEFSRPAAFAHLSYLNLPVLDLTAPSPEQLAAEVAFIGQESQRGIVLIHCKAGYSRTAAAAAAWLLSTQRARDADEAFARLIAVRPRIVIRPEICATLAR
jgi:protein-tyrosine phosphatase